MNEETFDRVGAAKLYSLARALTGALTARDVAAAVFDQALEALGANTAGLWLVEAGTLHFVGGAGLLVEMPAVLAAIPMDSDLPAAHVVRTGQPSIFGSRAERDTRLPVLTDLPSRSEATIVLPLTTSERTLGCLSIGYAGRMAEAEVDLDFLGRVAELSAAALDRAQLHDSEKERQAFLLDASTAVATAGGIRETLQRLAHMAVPRLADLCLIDVWEERGRIVRMAAAHADPALAPAVAELRDRYSPSPDGPHPATQAMAEKRSLVLAEMSDEYLRETTRDEHHYELVRRMGFTSAMCVPFLGPGRALGALTLVSAGSGRRFGPSDISLAEDLASRMSGVVSAAQRRDREHELAHVLQQLLLPEAIPRVEGLDISARYLTAHSEAEAGGDFYDVVALPSGRLGFAIGDVEGHDAMAAATMGQLRSALRALAGQHREPHLLLDNLRWSWDLLGFRRMATCLLGRLDQRTGDLVMTAAGHPPPVLVDASGHADLLVVDRTPPLGSPGRDASVSHHFMEPGATLFMYTDGLIEGGRLAIDAELEKVVESLTGTGDLPLDEVCRRMEEVHVGTGDRPDDVAMMAIRRSPG